MTSYRLTLVLAGAFAVAVIAVATGMAHRTIVSPFAFAAMLFGTYAVGLGFGRLVLGAVAGKGG